MFSSFYSLFSIIIVDFHSQVYNSIHVYKYASIVGLSIVDVKRNSHIPEALRILCSFREPKPVC